MTTGSTRRNDTIQLLHVDDEPEFADLAATCLKREDERFEVETVTSASDGLAQLASTTIDCVISDYDMPGQDGIEFLQAVREEYPDLPFILFTGKGSEEVASDAFSAGASDYLQKTTGTDQYTVLANRIDTLVENTRSQRRHERHLKAIETAAEGIALFDADGYCRYTNERYSEIYGLTPTELRGRHWEDFYPPEEIPYVYEEIMTVLDEEGYWHGQTTNLDADGETFQVDHTVSTTDDGGLVCTVRTLSEQDELEQRLTQYETVVGALDDPVYVCDEEGKFQYVNDAFAELVGYNRERIVGSHPRLIKDEEAVTVAERKLGEILSADGPESVTFEVTIQPQDGDPIPCEDHMGVLPYTGPRFNGSVGVLRDISTRKQREQTLEAQNRQLDEFASVVSHDLRNPLAQASGYLELAQTECKSDYLEKVAAAHRRMETLIDDLLTLAREGARTQELEQVVLRDVVETSWKNVATAEAELVVACDETIRADRSRLQQLLENLIRNAIEHGGSEVTVTVGELESGFYFEDDGPGITEEQRNSVFEAGYSTSEDGTGFGLSIVKQVADAHNWEIRVTDGNQGGARFEIIGVAFVAE